MKPRQTYQDTLLKRCVNTDCLFSDNSESGCATHSIYGAEKLCAMFISEKDKKNGK